MTLNTMMHRDEKLRIEHDSGRYGAIFADIEDLPFLAIESDGSPFPQVIEAKIEAFCLRAGRLHRKMLAHREK